MLTQTVDSDKKEIATLPIGDTVMINLLVLSGESKVAASLQATLARSGFACLVTSYEDALEVISRRLPDSVLADISRSDDTVIWQIIVDLKRQRVLPVIALVSEEALAGIDTHPEADDFIIGPCRDTELVLRIKRLVHKSPDSESSEQIKCDGLIIDLATCEVTVSGIKVELTFKEYELLKLLASNRGRVYTRDVLLDKIWGYDYFGGDRTVDVHIRRLRSKIEDASHTYIETVRNIGYKFIKSE